MTEVEHAEGGRSFLTDAEVETFASRIARGELVVVKAAPKAPLKSSK